MSTSHSRTWHSLAGFTLPGAPGDERLAIENLALELQALQLPEPLLIRFQTAIAEAIRSSIEYDLRGQMRSSLLIRVNVCTRDLPTQMADGGESGSPSGWGFFLIERRANVMGDTGRASKHMIELYLYQEDDLSPPLTEKS